MLNYTEPFYFFFMTTMVFSIRLKSITTILGKVCLRHSLFLKRVYPILISGYGLIFLRVYPILSSTGSLLFVGGYTI